MVLVALNPDDLFLITMETIIVIGLIISLIIALMVRSRYPKLTSQGWFEIYAGIACILFHGVFDVLDTLEWSIEILTDWFNVFDGLFFVIGLILVGVGIWKIANYGATAWEL